ncbi:MAG: hypothetical protein JXA07_01085 [Spirochaetes bacterium]|nr:hypothetical protein [Spirochaetota bacterium]
MNDAGKKLLLLCMLLMATALIGASGDDGSGVRAPGEPAAPAVDVGGERKAPVEVNYPVTLTMAKQEPLAGSLLLPFDSIDVEILARTSGRNLSIALASIRTIEYMRWSGTLRRKNEYAFYPALVTITLRDGKAYPCTRVTPALDRLVFQDEGGKRVLYAYFYDYRDGDKWKNSGAADMKYPETNPVVGTIVRIDFTATDMKSPLEMLFR